MKVGQFQKLWKTICTLMTFNLLSPLKSAAFHCDVISKTDIINPSNQFFPNLDSVPNYQNRRLNPTHGDIHAPINQPRQRRKTQEKHRPNRIARSTKKKTKKKQPSTSWRRARRERRAGVIFSRVRIIRLLCGRSLGERRERRCHSRNK